MRKERWRKGRQKARESGISIPPAKEREGSLYLRTQREAAAELHSSRGLGIQTRSGVRLFSPLLGEREILLSKPTFSSKENKTVPWTPFPLGK